MGVTYKFKQEVVDFIVQKKKDDPALSCRKLVDVVKAQFGVEVSKSSVSAVLQEFDLNSPVGRRAVYAPPKNFAIPQDRKETLLKNVAPFLTEVKLAVEAPMVRPEPLPALPEIPVRSNLALPAEPPKATEPLVSTSQDTLDAREESVGEGPVLQGILENHANEPDQPLLENHHLELPPIGLPAPEDIVVEPTEDAPGAAVPTVDEAHEMPVEPSMGMKLMPDLLAKADVLSPEVRIELLKASTEPQVLGGSIWGEDRGMCYDAMGLWIPIALLAHVQRAPYLGRLLAEKLGLSSDQDVSRRLEVAVLAQLFLSQTSTAAGEEDQMLPAAFQVTAREREDWISRLTVLQEDSQLLAGARSIFLSAAARVRAVRLVSSAGKHVYFDPQHQSCADDLAGICEGEMPLVAAIEQWIDRVVTGVEPFLLARLPWGFSEEKTQAFLQCLQAEKAWERIEFLGHGDETLASFDLIAGIRREFIFGVSLSDGEYARLDSDTIAPHRVYVEPFSEKEFSFFDGTLSVEGQARTTRTIVVSQEGVRKFVVITNSLRPPEEVFSEYLYASELSIHHNDGENDLKNADIVGNSVDSNGILSNDTPQDDVSTNIFVEVHKKIACLATQHVPLLCPETLAMLCRLPGFFKVKPGLILVRLCPPASFSAFPALEQSVFLINRLGPCDYVGNRICFSIEKN